jgi:putative membrane protein
MVNLENEKSDFEHTREQLANERTFLAWVRTCLAIIGLGFVVVKFSLFVREMEMMVSARNSVRHTPAYSLPLGILLIALGAVITIMSYLRYRRLQSSISKGEFVQSSNLIRVITILLVVACTLLIIYLWTTT